MRDFLATVTGKLVRLGLSFRRGGGHALPGLIIEKLFPGYVSSMLGKLPGGLIIITGTNGKTTTTKIVVQILREGGKKVLTNTTGSNLVRGIASDISANASLLGALKFDIAVLEVDEATAKLLVQSLKIKPRWVVGLNVSRDQLDRYGEIDSVASYINAAMKGASEGIIANADDPHLLTIAQNLSKNKSLIVKFFGVDKSLNKFFPSDYELAAVNKAMSASARARPKNIDVELADFDEQKVTYKVGSKKYETAPKLSGQHNFLNGAAALVICHQLLPGVPERQLIDELAKVSLAFGRGERYRLRNGAEIELVLVKNPASFTQALSSYASKSAKLMIAINDNIADGRDVSWLWDVDFKPLAGQKVALTSGTRAADMALRLSYEGIKTDEIEPNLTRSLKNLSGQTGKKIILSTYSAMLELYRQLSKEGERLP